MPYHSLPVELYLRAGTAKSVETAGLEKNGSAFCGPVCVGRGRYLGLHCVTFEGGNIRSTYTECSMYHIY